MSKEAWEFVEERSQWVESFGWKRDDEDLAHTKGFLTLGPGTPSRFIFGFFKSNGKNEIVTSYMVSTDPKPFIYWWAILRLDSLMQERLAGRAIVFGWDDVDGATPIHSRSEAFKFLGIDPSHDATIAINIICDTD